MNIYCVSIFLTLTPMLANAQVAGTVKYYIDDSPGNRHEFIVENEGASPLISYVVLRRGISNHTGKQNLEGWDFHDCTQKREPAWLNNGERDRLRTAIEDDPGSRYEYEVGAALFQDGSSFGTAKWVDVLSARRKANDDFLAFAASLLREKRKEGVAIASLIPPVEAKRTEALRAFSEIAVQQDVQAKYDWFLHYLKAPAPEQCQGCPPPAPTASYDMLIRAVSQQQDKVRACWGN